MTSPARQRILDTATRLFYTEGVRAVGIDRIIAEAGVAKATFYHHFPAKDELVTAYVEDQGQRQRALADELPEGPGRERLLTLFERMGEFGSLPGYRGCPFINAAAEYPDRSHPVRKAVAAFREWFRDLMLSLLKDARHPTPEETADILMIVRDGVAVGFDLDDPAVVRASIRETVTRVLGPAQELS
ncbi:TetR/AcrR family transcriptional regulator [Nonomuraea endophytica]|uniref:AcrR family transcriptional regulator n=1 Tax=Nonomuraea endophytica TaxID=714136 RepID=A0A7W8AE86_9ACTN|nr:TetR/AcrR family transcriptional regulator [Nonomuraea endophytica]MBB5083466.1 AcrR family transcriptional regulator [Nonomuraea endophytica]